MQCLPRNFAFKSALQLAQGLCPTPQSSMLASNDIFPQKQSCILLEKTSPLHPCDHRPRRYRIVSIMDPLSALSLAGAVVQFVQFTAALLRSTRSIHSWRQNSSGVSSEIEKIDDIYRKLSSLSSTLRTRSRANPPTDADSDPIEVSEDSSDIQELAAQCQEDCDRLLAILDKLKPDLSCHPKIWKSFRLALQQTAKADEIDKIQGRLTNIQTVILIHITTLSR